MTSQATISAESEHHVQGSVPVSIESFLRWGGVLSLVLGGTVYMLQGLEDVSGPLRTWLFPIMMLAMLGGGVLSLNAFKDSKGARLFFALACALVPVYSSQLAGWLYQLFGAMDTLPDWFLVTGGDIASFSFAGVVSLIAAVGSAVFGVSVLAKPDRKFLILGFLFLNALILAPWRVSLLGYGFLVMQLAGYFAVYYWVFQRDNRYKTFEGMAVKAIFALPALIMAVRTGFYVNDDIGLGLLLAVCGFFITALAQFARPYPVFRELVLLKGFSAIFFAWILLGHEFYAAFFAGFAVAIAIVFSILSLKLRSLYRHFAGLCLVFSLALCVIFGVGNWSLFLVVVAFSFVAVALKSKAMVGWSVIAFLQTVGLAASDIWGVINFNIWVTLTLGGFLAILMASAYNHLMRFSRMLFEKAQHSAADWQ